MRSLVVLLALCACGPKVIWTGRTADRMHQLELRRDDGLDFILVDGKRRAAYRGIAGWSIALAGEHVAFAAKLGAHWVVVHDGVLGREQWDGIGELRLTPDNRLVYIAQRAGGWHVVADGAVGPRVEAVLAGSLQIAAAHVAYVAHEDGGVRVIADGKPGPRYDGIGQLVLADDGRIAYAARHGFDAYAVIGHVQSQTWDSVAQLQLGPAGRFAYVAASEGAVRLVVDGKPGPLVDEVRELVFRDDGNHVAALVRVGSTSMVMLDGNPIDAELRDGDGKLAFRPGGGDAPGLAYVASTPLGRQVVVDQWRGPHYDDVRAPVWSSDGGLAYAARRGATWRIVHRDRELEGGDSVGNPVVAGSRVAYAGRRGKRAFVVVDGTTYDFDLVFEDTVAFSRDGRHWGAVAGDVAREQLFIVIDGKRRVPVQVRELYSAVASGADEAALRTWTQVELDRAQAPRATPAARR